MAVSDFLVAFAQTFGQISDQTVTRNLKVQPALEIRPGYRLNVLVDLP
ncbi:hypothetical protein [Devosia nitrariae]|nr:hypothetical protein [Devosia nitrariae]